MCLNPVNGEFDRAYANVGLLASNVWSFQKELVDYKKANLYLWVQFNKTEQRLIEEECDNRKQITNEERIRTVRDTIPFSRLASYNDYCYNEKRERMYVSDDEPAQYIQNALYNGQRDLEVWMLPQVEEEFIRLTHVSSSRWCTFSPRIPKGQEIMSVDSVTTVNPYQWLTETRWPVRLLARYPDLPRTLQDQKGLSLFREDLYPPLYNLTELEDRLQEFPCPRYLLETDEDFALHLLMDCRAMRHLWQGQTMLHGGFGLNEGAQEFHPALRFDVRTQHYLSIYDSSYEEDLFPYSIMPGGHQMQDTVANVYIRQDQQVPNTVELQPYFTAEEAGPAWKTLQEVAQANRITLNSFDGLLIREIPNIQNMLYLCDKWLNKIYNPRSIDFSAMALTSSRIDNTFRNVHKCYCLTQSAVPGSEGKYDELEREALEQYSNQVG